MTLLEWRWEFLRRRADYRAAWEDHSAVWQATCVAEFSACPTPAGVTSWGDHFKDICKLPGDAQQELFGVKFVLNPSVEKLPRFSQWLFFADKAVISKRRAHRQGVPEWKQFREEGLYSWTFDLTQALSPQLHRVIKTLEAIQKEGARPTVSRVRAREWAEYLRMLDLAAQGLSAEQIGRVIYPRESNEYPHFPVTKKVRTALSKAEDLQRTFAVGR